MADTTMHNITWDGTRKEIDVTYTENVVLWTAADDVQLSFDSLGANSCTIWGEMQQNNKKLYFKSASWVLNYQLLSS